MSEENVEIVRRAFEAFTRGDIEAVLRMCDEDVVVTQAQELPGVPPPQRGHEGVLIAFAYWPQQWDDYRIEIRGVIADPGDHVVVGTRESGRGKQSGVDVVAEFTFLFTVRDKKITELRTFVQEDQALEAAGLRE
jgi:ketosteroid isomerase-like protein